ncbi:MAG TPA: DUF433 domain-containing protein [Candidatus Angelobacter sp.]|nr:DUF433 domain-containing protein [Candidatus Angelobacter sp.]
MQQGTITVIHSDPAIHGGDPVFKGSRVPFQTLLDHVEHAGKRGFEEFLEGFDIPREQAIAALREKGLLHLIDQ